MKDDLVARLAVHLERWPTVYGSDRANREILDEALREIISLRLLLDCQRWHPIETAPKDGTRIDLWAGQRIFNAVWRAQFKDETDPYCFTWWAPEPDCECRGIEWEDQRIGVDPTHWMPIPKPPCNEREWTYARAHKLLEECITLAEEHAQTGHDEAREALDFLAEMVSFRTQGAR